MLPVGDSQLRVDTAGQSPLHYSFWLFVTGFFSLFSVVGFVILLGHFRTIVFRLDADDLDREGFRFVRVLDADFKCEYSGLGADLEVGPGGTARFVIGVIVFAEQPRPLAVIDAQHSIDCIVFAAEVDADHTVCRQCHAIAHALLRSDQPMRQQFRAADPERQFATVDQLAENYGGQVFFGRLQQQVAVIKEAIVGDGHEHGRRDAPRLNVDILVGIELARHREADFDVIRHEEIIDGAAQAARGIVAHNGGAIANRHVVGKKLASAEAAGGDDNGDLAIVAQILTRQAESILRIRIQIKLSRIVVVGFGITQDMCSSWKK